MRHRKEHFQMALKTLESFLPMVVISLLSGWDKNLVLSSLLILVLNLFILLMIYSFASYIKSWSMDIRETGFLSLRFPELRGGGKREGQSCLSLGSQAGRVFVF